MWDNFASTPWPNRSLIYARWLGPTDEAHLPVDLLRLYPAEQMKSWKVGSAMGNARNNSPDLVAPI